MPDYANAKPTKKFFIDMLTRDISLEDAILDLIDNAIDSLIRTRNIDISANIFKSSATPVADITDIPKINVYVSNEQFKIVDFCGGIDLESAKKEVFRFGRIAHSEEATLSVYGIGLKRAIFKLGKIIKVESRTLKDGFEVNIDVDEWAKETPDSEINLAEWSFPLQPKQMAESVEKAGTTIIVDKLNPEVIMRINDGTLESRLEKIISTTYPLFLEKYVSVKINDNSILPQHIPLGMSDEVTPAFNVYDYDNVKLTVMTGLAERIDNKWPGERAGWYVLCNGRVVVSADKTDLTGWGVGGPQFQPQFRGFLGIAFFFSVKPENLPWTTTKRGLNRESIVFQVAKNKMLIAARPVLEFLRSMYQSDEAEQPVQREIADNVKAVDVLKIFSQPETDFKISHKSTPTKKESIRVQYEAKLEEIAMVKKCLKKQGWSAGKVGRYALEYLIEQECAE